MYFLPYHPQPADSRFLCALLRSAGFPFQPLLKNHVRWLPRFGSNLLSHSPGVHALQWIPGRRSCRWCRQRRHRLRTRKRRSRDDIGNQFCRWIACSLVSFFSAHRFFLLPCTHSFCIVCSSVLLFLFPGWSIFFRILVQVGRGGATQQANRLILDVFFAFSGAFLCTERTFVL